METDSLYILIGFLKIEILPQLIKKTLISTIGKNYCLIGNNFLYIPSWTICQVGNNTCTGYIRSGGVEGYIKDTFIKLFPMRSHLLNTRLTLQVPNPAINQVNMTSSYFAQIKKSVYIQLRKFPFLKENIFSTKRSVIYIILYNSFLQRILRQFL